MVINMTRRAFVLVALACSSCQEEPAATEAPDAAIAADATDAADGSSPASACHYVNPFSGIDECKTYLGPWTEQQMQEDCLAPLLGMAEPGVLRETTCAETGVVGTCTVEYEDGRTEVLRFYGGPQDALSSSCENILHGTYEKLTGEQDQWRAALPEALEAMKSTDSVTVEPECTTDDCINALVADEKWIAFTPAQFTSGKGLVFWPGGMVDPRAYAVVAAGMAEGGLRVIVPSLSRNTVEQFAMIRGAYADVAEWFVGGHSHGGVLALQAATQDATGMSGLALWASIPTVQTDLHDAAIRVLLLWGTNDGRITAGTIADTKLFLPADAEIIEILGGNHVQFANYEPSELDVDLPATITREQQQAQAITATLDFLHPLQ